MLSHQMMKLKILALSFYLAVNCADAKPPGCISRCAFLDRPSKPGSRQILPYGVQMIQADSKDAGPSSLLGSDQSAWVCVMDSGVDNLHRDLKENKITGCLHNCDFYPFNSTDNVSKDHGTVVTGIISAWRSNGIDVVGVIPNGAKIYEVKSRIWRTFMRVGGMRQCVEHLDKVKKKDAAARMVINMSLGDGEDSEEEEKFIDEIFARGDVLLVAASGNQQKVYPNAKMYPAAYKNVISVANVNCNETINPTSTRNAGVDIAAPGTEVLSTVPRERVATTNSSISAVAKGGAGKTMKFAALPVGMSAVGKVKGDVVNCKEASAPCKNAQGKICVIDIYGYSFAPHDLDLSCKVKHAVAGGCAGVIFTDLTACGPVENIQISEYGSCELKEQLIVAGALSTEDGASLVKMIKQGPVTAVLETQRYIKYSFVGRSTGTSMASPYVAGVAARIWASFPKCTNADVRKALMQSAKHLGKKGKNEVFGNGLVQAVDARKLLKSYPCAKK